MSADNSLREAIAFALMAASTATTKMLQDNPGEWYPCGFATVRIKPARGKLVKALKDSGIGQVAYDGGYIVMNPSGNGTQWMYAKEAGARAFKDSLVLWLLANPEIAGATKITVETQID